MNTVSWTDVLQAIAAVIAVPGAIAGFIILFRKDKEKEREINNLTDIADRLTLMTEASETRYRNTKKPKISFDSQQNSEGSLVLQFYNSHTQSTLTHYAIDCDIEDLSIAHLDINDIAGIQQFMAIFGNIDFNVQFEQYHTLELQVEYQTEEGYLFSQDISLSKHDGLIYITSSAITEK